MKRRGRHRRPQLFLKGRSPRARRRLLAVFALIFAPALAPRAARAACVEFVVPPELLPAIGGIQSIVAGDVDRDGDLDLAVAADLDTVAWYRNLGTGWTVTVAGGASGIWRAEIGDLDGDGDLDAVAAAEYDGRIDWYENLNDGASWNQHEIATALTDSRLAHVGDFDGDGDLDVVARFNVPEPPPDDLPGRGLTPPYTVLNLYTNDGGGAAWSPGTIASVEGLDESYAFASADLNGDGKLDLVEGSLERPLVWYPNTGFASFGAAQTIATSLPTAFSVVAADFDRDGDVDLAAAFFGSNLVTLFENDGNGSSWTRATIHSSTGGAYHLAAADLDGDGDTDILATGSFSGDLAWFENDGFALTTWTRHRASTQAGGSRAIAAADLDADGDLDLAGPASTAVRSAIFDNALLRGEPLPGSSTTIATGFVFPRAVAAADLDADGDLDALTVASGSGGLNQVVSWFENFDQGDVWLPVTISTALGGSYGVVPADVDGDGDLDVVAGGFSSDDVVWFVNDGTPEGAVWTLRTITTLADLFRSAAVHDLDRDGDLDVLSASSTDHTVAWYESNGAGTVWTQFEISTAFNSAWGVTAGDLDGDGDPDVVAGGVGEVAWFANDGSPENAGWSVVTIATAVQARVVELADLDRDGDLDLAVGDTGADLFAWYENDGGGGGWQRRTISIAADDLRSVEAVDFDRDGDLDLLTASLAGNLVSWFENDGTPASGEWARHTFATASNGPQTAVAADVDGDGDFDTLSVGTVGGTVEWTENLGTKVHDDGFDSDANTACWSSAVP